MPNYHITVVMAVDKRCAASGRVLQAKSARSKIYLWKTAITNKSMNKRQFATMSLLQYNAMSKYNICTISIKST